METAVLRLNFFFREKVIKLFQVKFLLGLKEAQFTVEAATCMKSLEKAMEMKEMGNQFFRKITKKNYSEMDITPQLANFYFKQSTLYLE